MRIYTIKYFKIFVCNSFTYNHRGIKAGKHLVVIPPLLPIESVNEAATACFKFHNAGAAFYTGNNP